MKPEPKAGQLWRSNKGRDVLLLVSHDASGSTKALRNVILNSSCSYKGALEGEELKALLLDNYSCVCNLRDMVREAMGDGKI